MSTNEEYKKEKAKADFLQTIKLGEYKIYDDEIIYNKQKGFFTCQNSSCESDDEEIIVVSDLKKFIDKKYNYEKIELEKLKDDIKEKTIIVEYLKKKLEKEKKKLEGLKYYLEELELLNIKEE